MPCRETQSLRVARLEGWGGPHGSRRRARGYRIRVDPGLRPLTMRAEMDRNSFQGGCTMTALSVGVIGIGALGSRVALRLLWNGFHTLQLYDVNDISTRQFTNDYGGMLTGSPKMMAQTCDAVVNVMPSAAEVRGDGIDWEVVDTGVGDVVIGQY